MQHKYPAREAGRLLLSIIHILAPMLLMAQSKINFLKIGDKAPPIQVYKWLKGTPVSEFKKGKTYLIEFGATWCAPCAAAIPHLSELALKHEKNLVVIGVFVMEYKKNYSDTSYIYKVQKYITNQAENIQFTVAVDGPDKQMETLWLKSSETMGIPQSFLIDKNGIIAWTGYPDPQKLNQITNLVNDKSYNIEDAIAANIVDNSAKPPLIDPLKPLYIDANGKNEKDFLYRSILTKYKGEKVRYNLSEIVFSRHWSKLSAKALPYAGMVMQIGVPIAKLYYMAYADTISPMLPTRYADGTDKYPDTVKHPTLSSSYGKYWYRVILKVKDSTPFMTNSSLNNNRFNYNLIVPDEKANAKFMQEEMQRDLQGYFGYKVSVYDSLMPCWNLTASAKAKSALRTKTPGLDYKSTQINDSTTYFTNAIMKDILMQIITSFSFGYSKYGVRPRQEAPFIDETGVSDQIDYSITNYQFKEMETGNWNAAIDFLKRNGLYLEKSKRKIKVVVIEDPENN